MKRLRLMIAVLTAAVLLSGCRALSLYGPDILTPPRASGGRAEIQHMIEEDAGGGYTLIYPSSGDYKSGVLLYDLDHNGAEEAIALYTSTGGSAKLLCAASQGESFKLIGSAELPSSNVNSLRFADVDGDGRDEIVVSCDAGAPIASLNAYLVGEELSRVKIAEGFTDFVTGDFDGDGAGDVLLLMPHSENVTAKAILMSYSGGSFSGKSEIEIDSEVYFYDRLYFGALGKDVVGAAADGVLENGDHTTQLLCYDPGAKTLLNPLYIFSGYSDTRRSERVFSRDINDDGVIEYPLCDPMEAEKGADPASICTRIVWCDYDYDEMLPAPVGSAIYCEPLGCMLMIRDELVDSLTARVEDGVMTVYSLSHKGAEPVVGAVQLTVKHYDHGSFDSSLIPEAVLYESSTDVFTYILPDKSVFTPDDVKNSFTLMNNTQ